MNIIFDRPDLHQIKDRYIVLELDTFHVTEIGELRTAWALIEHIGLQDIPQLPNWQDLHQRLMHNYRKQNWTFCQQAIQHLRGRWNGELDSFYNDLEQRILHLCQSGPGADWSPVIVRA